MSNLLFILLALLILSVIVTIHEFGHYLLGRSLGIGIVEFSVGMGPKIVSWKKKDIQYSLRWVPLGGYCSFVGEDASSTDPRAMNNQPVWKRFLTVLAGPAFNFMIAIVIAVALIAGGLIANPFETVSGPMVTALSENMPAEKAGFLPGDLIITANGESISNDDAGMERVREIIAGSEPGSEIAFTVLRNGERVPIQLVPEFVEEENRFMIGIVFASYYAAYDCNVISAIPEAFTLVGRTVVYTVSFLKDMIVDLFTGQKIEQGSVSGVVGIVSTLSTDMKANFVEDFSYGIYTVLYWIMVISMNLGIMNLLPLPALDGGRLVFLAVEGVRRKPVSREKEGLVHLIGFGLLIVLMIVVTYSDIVALFK